MNKIYTTNDDRYNESTDWVHHFFVNNLYRYPITNLEIYNVDFWEGFRQLSLLNHHEAATKKRAFTLYPTEKIFSGVEEKDPFLLFDDEKHQHVTIHKAAGIKYYVSVDHYLNRKTIF